MEILAPVFLVTIFLNLVNCSNAQDKTSTKFGKVSYTDFDVKPPAINSDANAIIVADWGNSQIIGQTDTKYEGFNTQRHKVYVNTTLLKFERKTIIKIINKNGFDAATVNIYLYNSRNDSEKVEGLKACTYNIKRRRVVKTKLNFKMCLLKS